MAVTPEQKLKTKLKRLTTQRTEVREQKAALEAKEKSIGLEIIETLEALGERDTVKLFPKMDGFRVDRPKTMKINEDRLSEWLKDKAPKVHKAVFEKVVKFNKGKFEEAVTAGDIPDVDEVLTDEDVISFVEQAPRLMPSKAKAPSLKG